MLNEIEAEGPETLSAVTAIRLLMLTGCQLNEIQTLRWEDVDLEAAGLRFRTPRPADARFPWRRRQYGSWLLCPATRTIPA